MIKEKFLKFLLWLKDHFLFLLEVVIRLSVGWREENNQVTTKDDSKDHQKEGTYDK